MCTQCDACRYTWEEWTKCVNPPEPQSVTEPFAPWLRPGPTRIDLHYKARERVGGPFFCGALRFARWLSHRDGEEAAPWLPSGCALRPTHSPTQSAKSPTHPTTPPPTQTGKTADWEREEFDVIKHAKIGFFSSIVGVAAVPALFK